MSPRCLVVAFLLASACGAGAPAPEADPASGPSSPSPPPAAAPSPGPTSAPVTRPDDPARPLPALPLRTEGRYIVDAKGKRFKLASVNWYGAEERDFVVAGLDRAPLATIAKQIQAAGFNSVRLPWSNELVETNPVVAAARVAANPSLAGKRALDVLDAVIAALAHEGLVVILDNHTSRADWCCTTSDGNGLWFTDAYPESRWTADWRTIVKRYAAQPAVVGADLRNELRAMPDGRKATWGGPDPALDWRAGAKRGADAVLDENPKLLVIVEGLEYATDLGGAYAKPLVLSVPNRLVYSAHDYSWFHNGITTYDELHTALGNKWGFLLKQNEAYTAPVWVGEFGTQHDAANVAGTSGAGFWFQSFRKYVTDADIDWCYWALNGTQATGTSRTLGAEEGFGFLDTTWTKPAAKALTDALAPLVPAREGPL